MPTYVYDPEVEYAETCDEYARLTEELDVAEARRLARRFHSGQTRVGSEYGRVARPLEAHLRAVSELAGVVGARLYEDADGPEIAYHRRVCTVAGLLHECLETGPIRWMELAQYTDGTTAKVVAEISADKRLPDPKRNEWYVNATGRASLDGQAVKFADLRSDAHCLVEITREAKGKEFAPFVQNWTLLARQVYSGLGAIRSNAYLGEQRNRLENDLSALESYAVRHNCKPTRRVV